MLRHVAGLEKPPPTPRHLKWTATRIDWLSYTFTHNQTNNILFTIKKARLSWGWQIQWNHECLESGRDQLFFISPPNTFNTLKHHISHFLDWKDIKIQQRNVKDHQFPSSATCYPTYFLFLTFYICRKIFTSKVEGLAPAFCVWVWILLIFQICMFISFILFI